MPGSVEVVKLGRMSVLPSGMRVPRSLDVRAVLPEHPELEVFLRLEPIDGVYEPVEVTVTNTAGGAVSAAALRDVPIRTIARRAVYPALKSINLHQVLTPSDDARTDEANRARNTALTYRVARLAGEAPTVAVQRASRVSRATAVRRVAEARRLGYLDADEIGQAGGAPSRMKD